MNKSRLLDAVSACVITFISLSADAALLPRLGGLAVYDTIQDITWLADANAAAGSTYETVGVAPGQMTWINANAWASSLTVGGFTDWRLPTTADPDPTCTDDIAGTFPSADPVAFNCTGSEMGHLFYIGFGATTDTVVFVTGDPTELAKFTNVLNSDFWSGTSFPVDLANPNSAYSFNFSHGTQGGGPKTDSAYAWAVRDGDVGIGAVPVPAAAWLFCSGLIGLIGMTRRKKTD